MILYLLRGSFILLAAAVTMLYVLPFQADQALEFSQVVLMLGITLGLTILVVAVDAYIREKKLSALSGIFLGLIAGLVVAFALSFVVDLFAVISAPDVTMDNPTFSRFDLARMNEEQRRAAEFQVADFNRQIKNRAAYLDLLEGVKVFIGLITCYMGMSLVIQTKDDFRFVIPYVEFAKQIRGNRPTLLDTSVIIDGRVLEIVETQIMQGSLLVPKFVLNELQFIADSADKLKRSRGRRGLEVLQKLKSSRVVDLAIEDAEAEGATVDQMLLSRAQAIRARIMTNDYNLNKIAQLRGVDVININDLAKALQPVVLPGEFMNNLTIIKAGEGAGQGVGYLDDGTMIVVENARSKVGQEIDLVVTSMHQTSAGRMIFGRLTTEEGGDTVSVKKTR